MSMKNSAILGEALISMRATGLRTFLTMLGIIIGVGSVVLMLAIGRGVEISVRESIASQGANLFIIVPGATTSSGIRSGSGGAATLTVGDSEELSKLPGVAAVAPNVGGAGQVVYEGQNW
ncbi:MAG: ABC transporter permease, partial [Phycisphaerae bacterium]